MKYVFLALALSFSVLTSADSIAQKADKKEIKKWSTKLKGMDPLDFKKMYEELPQLKSETSAYKAQIETLKSEKEKNEKEINALKSKLNTEKSTAESKMKKAADAEDVTKQGDNYDEGVVFKVQIGAYESLGSDMPVGDDTKVGVEPEGDIHKFTAGYFRDYAQSRIFRDYLREMGVKGAFVVGYENTSRIADIEDALKRAGQEKYIEEFKE